MDPAARRVEPIPFNNIILHQEEFMYISTELGKQSVGLVVTWWSGVEVCSDWNCEIGSGGR